MSRRQWLERHPATVTCVVFLLVFIPADLIVGSAMIPAINRVFHPYYHHDFSRNASFLETWGKRQYRIDTNSLGFKDAAVREVSLAPAGDRKRILIMGDSFAEGIGLPFEETFAGLLQRRLDPAHHEVLNGGLASYSPLFYYLKVRYLLEIEQLRFDQLLVFIDISDIQDEVEFHGFDPHLRTPLARRVDVFLKGNSYTYSSLRPFLKAGYQRVTAFAAHGDEADGVQTEGESVQRLDVAEFFAHRGEERARWTFDDAVYARWGRRGVNIALANLGALADLCKEHGIELSVVVYPWPEQIEQHDLDSRQVRIWREFAAQHHAGFINLFPDFINDRSAKETIGRYFIPGDAHWNEAGHRLVAERVLQALAAGQGGVEPE